MNATRSPGHLAVDNFVAEEEEEVDTGYLPSMMATGQKKVAKDAELNHVAQVSAHDTDDDGALMQVVEARALKEGSLLGEAESPVWVSGDALPGGCSCDEPAENATGSSMNNLEENLATAVRQAAETVGDDESGDVDPESYEVLADASGEHRVDRLAALMEAGSQRGDKIAPCEEPDDDAKWVDPVEKFVLDQDFDYDQIKLTPKPDIETMRRKWEADRSQRRQAPE